ncbi:MAG: PQQ-binding-like beta-propeller repeat protein [Pseudobdellovibrionaceae bacterium]
MNLLRISFLLSLVTGFTTSCSTLEKWNQSEKRVFNIEKRWVRTTLTSENLTFRKANRMTPIIAGSLLIQGNALDSISAFDRSTGTRVWTLKIKGGVEGGAVAAGDHLFFGANDGSFYAVSLQTGAILWTFPTRSETLSAPTLHNGVVFFLAGNNVVYALEAETGKQLWLYSKQDPQNLSIRGGSKPSISATGKTLFVGFSDGSLVSLDVANGGLKWEKQLSQNKRFRDIDSSPVRDAEILYVPGFDDALYAIRSTNGDILWKYEKGGYGDLIINMDRIYYSTTNNEVVCLEKSTGKELWSYKLIGGLGTQPVYTRGLVVVGESQGHVIFLDANSGRKVGQFESGLGVLSPISADDKLSEIYFISNEANLYSLRATWKNGKTFFPWL